MLERYSTSISSRRPSTAFRRSNGLCRRTLTHDRSSAILGTTALIRAYIALFRGELARWLELARQALDILPAAAAIGRTSAHLDIASAFVISGDVTAATEHRLAAAVAAVRDIGERSTHFRGMVTLAELRWRQGRLHQAAATYREAARLLPDPVMLQATPMGLIITLA